MKKSLLTLGLAMTCAFGFAQPPQNQGGRPPVPNADSLRPGQSLFGPLIKRFQVHGYAQAGYEWNNKLDQNTNGFNFKRAGLVVFAQVTDRWSFFFFDDLASEIQDFYTDFRITGSKALNVRLGEFKNSLGLENPYSPAVLELIDVTSQATTFFCGTVDPLFADKVMYGRDLGAMLFGELFGGHFKYELALMNGSGINRSDNNNQKDFLAKLEYAPMPNLRFVTSGQRGHATAASYCWLSPDSPFISPYNREVKAGEHYERDRWTFGAEYKSFVLTPAGDWTKRPVSLRTEVMGGRDKDVESFGGYVIASVPIYKTLEGVLSYDFINYNTSEDLKSTKYTAGLQYWFYRQCRVQLQYTHTVLDNMTAGEPVIIQNPAGPPTVKYNFQPDFDMIQLQLQIGF
jgi:hypothetical protein